MNDKYLNDILAKQEYIQQNMPRKDPFDKGIMRAIKSAKESIGMDEDQSDRAIRNSLLSFGKAMYNEPKKRGFMANFAQVGRALAPALQTHDQYEDVAKRDNKQMLQYAQNLRASEEAKMAALEQQAYLREHADEVLTEQKAHHKMMSDAAMERSYLAKLKLSEKEDKSPFKDIYGKNYHKLDNVEIRTAEKARTDLGNTKLAYDSAKKTQAELEALTGDNKFAPMGGAVSRVSNPIKDVVGRVANREDMIKETSLRNSFKAQLGNVIVMLETAKTKKALTQGTYDRLRDNFPNIDTDPIGTIVEKMRFLTEEVDLYSKAANLTSEYGVKINPSDVEEFEAHIKANKENRERMVIAIDPDTGEEIQIPAWNMKEAENRGLRVR